VLRAVVSRDFSTIQDSTIASQLAGALAKAEPNARIVRWSTTDLTTSFVVKVGEPIRGGNGTVGDVWGCLYVRNSGVGYAKLIVTLFLHRLACKNGLVVPLPGSSIIRARHRHLDEDDLAVALAVGLQDLPARLHRGARVLADAETIAVADVEDDVRAALRAAKLPVRLVAPVMRAWNQERGQSRFAVSQAITLAAQWESSSEACFEMELAAGAYLAATGS
jgi:hypothetical protein